MTYSSSLTMNRQRYAARQQNTAKFDSQTKTLGPISNTIVLLILICVLGLMYLTQVTKTNALSYTLNDLKNQQQSLQTEHNELQITSARLQSLERVKSSDVAAELVTITPSGAVQN